MKYLRSLFLGQNQITGTLPSRLGSIDSLRTLECAYNQLEGDVPNSLNNSVFLQKVYVHFNKLSGFPDLSSLPNLLEIGINDNRFTFEDIEPLVSKNLPVYNYSPQDSVGVYFDTTLEVGSYSSFPLFVGGANNQYTWYRNGVPSPNMSMTCIMPSVSFEDSGTYHCLITNTVATALTLTSRTYKLHVVPSPRMLDSLALVEVYDSTRGNSWINKANWKTSNPIDTWYGVEVFGGRVTGINLSFNGLVGAIPFSIESLTQLTILNLSSNQLSGPIPIQIGNLVQLKELRLNNNQLSGNIPSELGNLSALIEFYLSVNQLSGTIPSQIGNLTQLQHLVINNNHLSGSIPTQIGNLTAVRQLSLFDNKLSGDVPSLNNLTILNALYLHSNRLTGLPNLTTLPSLSGVSVENNMLTFEDIEPQFGKSYSAFTYSPQDSVGSYSSFITVEGTAHTLSVSVGGSHNQYHWIKNGVDIQDETNPDLYKLYWAVSDSGNYVCRITNTVATELTLYSRATKVIIYPQPTQPGNLVATPVSSSRIDLTWNASNDATKYFIFRSQTLGSGFNLIDSVNVPATSYSNTGLSVNTTYYYRIYAANQYGATSPNSNEASATTLGIAPSLGTPNVSNLSPIPSAAVTITVTATGTSPVVKLFYGKTTQTEGDSLTMTYNGTNYSGTIPGSAVTQEGVWFRIRAQNTGGIVYYPTTSRASISVTINDMTSIWDNSHFYGGIPDKQYFTISMSMNASLSLTDLWGAQTLEEDIPTNWRAWRFDNATQSFVDVTSLSGDMAYFIFHRQGSAQEIFNSAISRKTNDPAMFGDIILKPQWNAVPWPYTFPANIYIKDTNQDSIGSVWKLWGNSGWEQVTDCSPFCGYMIYNKTGGDIRLGDVLSFSKIVSKSITDISGWRIRLIAESGEYRDAYNFAGVSKNFTTLSEPEPIAIGKSVSLNFISEGQNLSSDIRSDAEEGHVWDMILHNTTGTDRAVLKWENHSLPPGLHVALIDVSNNKIVPIESLAHEYKFRSHVRNTFKLIAGTADYVEKETRRIKSTLPDEFRLSQNYPNPFNPSTTIKFDVARSGRVELKIYNILGQEVVALVNGYYETGKDYSVFWDGKNTSGQNAASGIYICRLRSGNISRNKKMLLIR